MKQLAKSMGAALLAGALFLTGCGGQSAATGQTAQSGEAAQAGQTLNLYTWEGMFPQEILDGFTQETGIEIQYSNFDFGEDMLAKLEEAKGGDYDLVIADDYIVDMAIQSGLAQKLDKARISTYENINPVFMSQFYDEENAYTVPYGAGIPLIVYDSSLTNVAIDSYASLWDPALEDNVAIIGNHRVVNGMALKALGQSFNTEDLEVIQQAGDKLLELAPNIRVIGDSNTQDFLVSGEVAAAFLYTSQVYAAKMAREDLTVVYPKEGLGFGIMAAFVPSQAPNAAAAHKFLEYISDGERAARCFEHLGYYCTNKAAEEFIAEEMRSLIILPEDAAQGEIIQNISQEAEDLHGRIFSEFKAACD